MHLSSTNTFRVESVQFINFFSSLTWQDSSRVFWSCVYLQNVDLPLTYCIKSSTDLSCAFSAAPDIVRWAPWTPKVLSVQLPRRYFTPNQVPRFIVAFDLKCKGRRIAKCENFSGLWIIHNQVRGLSIAVCFCFWGKMLFLWHKWHLKQLAAFPQQLACHLFNMYFPLISSAQVCKVWHRQGQPAWNSLEMTLQWKVLRNQNELQFNSFDFEFSGIHGLNRIFRGRITHKLHKFHTTVWYASRRSLQPARVSAQAIQNAFIFSQS